MDSTSLGTPTLYLAELRLTNFKNYESQQLNFSLGINALVGRNGMGKTNLLDAIYYLCMCKSNFGNYDRDIVRHGETFHRIEGNFSLEGKKEKIVVKALPGEKKKTIERNAKAYERIVDHVGLLPVVMIIPDDTRLATEGSEDRRKFIDNTLAQLDNQYVKHLLRYNRLLRQRNGALKQMAKSGYFDQALIEVLDQQLDEPAQYIAELRASFIEEFVPYFNEHYGILSEQREKVDCVYRTQLSDQPLSKLLKENIEKDRLLQRTTVGIHKDDLRFKIEDRPLKKFASQGQLKSFILALKLAQYQYLYGKKTVRPILLLDDIFDKLDRHRVKHLIDLIQTDHFGQVFITDTHETRLSEVLEIADRPHAIYKVDETGVNLKTDEET